MVGTNTKAMEEIISFLHFIKSFRHISIRWRYSLMETCMWGSCKGNPTPQNILIRYSTSIFGNWNLWWTPCLCFSKSVLLPKFLLFYQQLATSPGKVSRLCTLHSSGTVAALMIKWWLCWRHPKLGQHGGEIRWGPQVGACHRNNKVPRFTRVGGGSCWFYIGKYRYIYI